MRKYLIGLIFLITSSCNNSTGYGLPDFKISNSVHHDYLNIISQLEQELKQKNFEITYFQNIYFEAIRLTRQIHLDANKGIMLIVEHPNGISWENSDPKPYERTVERNFSNVLRMTIIMYKNSK